MRFFPVLLHQARKERKKTQTVRHERNNWLLCKAIIFKSVRCGWNGGRGDELDTNTRSSKKKQQNHMGYIQSTECALLCYGVTCTIRTIVFEST